MSVPYTELCLFSATHTKSSRFNDVLVAVRMLVNAIKINLRTVCGPIMMREGGEGRGVSEREAVREVQKIKLM